MKGITFLGTEQRIWTPSFCFNKIFVSAIAEGNHCDVKNSVLTFPSYLISFFSRRYLINATCITLQKLATLIKKAVIGNLLLIEFQI